MNVWKAFELAGKVANLKEDQRVHRLGAIGIRADGVIVAAPNSPAPDVTPAVHAEAKLSRKLDKGATVYVVRVSNDPAHKFKLARPCPSCQNHLRKKRVERVYYSISDTEYGVMEL